MHRCSTCAYAANTEKAKAKIDRSRTPTLDHQWVTSLDWPAVRSALVVRMASGGANISIECPQGFQGSSGVSYSVHLMRVYTVRSGQASGADNKSGSGNYTTWAVIVPVGRRVNPIKVKSHLSRHIPGANILDACVVRTISAPEDARQFAEEEEEEEEDKGAEDGTKKDTVSGVLVDESLVGERDKNAGAEGTVGDLVLAEEHDRCAEEGCDGALISSKGIEVGHVFYLGTKYSAKLNARVASTHGTQLHPEMVDATSTFCRDEPELNARIQGCYGLGVTRLLAAIVETSHDERGIVWPLAASPYKVGYLCARVVCACLMRSL